MEISIAGNSYLILKVSNVLLYSIFHVTVIPFSKLRSCHLPSPRITLPPFTRKNKQVFLLGIFSW